MSSSSYTITGGETLDNKGVAKASSGGGGGNPATITVGLPQIGEWGYTGKSEDLAKIVMVTPYPVAGDTVTLRVTPGTSFGILSVSVVDRADKAVELTDNKDGTYSFKMVSKDPLVKVVTFPYLADEHATAPVREAVMTAQTCDPAGPVVQTPAL